jgi:phosphoribosyl 1,2-cyclic phosphodiesterase
VRFCSLGSGSGGNALLVGSAKLGYVLLDCGFSVKELEARLATKAVHPHDLRAILVTHEHADHIGSAYAFAAKHALPVVMSSGTAKATQAKADKSGYSSHAIRRIYDGEVLMDYAGLTITAFSVPHDSAEPLQFTFHDGQRKLGVLTDIGMSTPHVLDALAACHSLVLECNHDEQMLKDGPYSQTLKVRVGGNWGHLSNRVAAQMLSELQHPQLRQVIAAHLSRQNNLPELAHAALAEVLGDKDSITCATQSEGFEWRDI